MLLICEFIGGESVFMEHEGSSGPFFAWSEGSGAKKTVNLMSEDAKYECKVPMRSLNT